MSDKDVNPYLRSDNWGYTSLKFEGRNLIEFKIDTFNVCRIQKSKIKAVSTYYFKSLSDSVLWRKRNFNIYGISDALDIKKDSFLKTDPNDISRHSPHKT